MRRATNLEICTFLLSSCMLRICFHFNSDLFFFQPGSSVMMCLVSDGKMSTEFGYNPGYIYTKSNDVCVIVTLVVVSYCFIFVK